METNAHSKSIQQITNQPPSNLRTPRKNKNCCVENMKIM